MENVNIFITERDKEMYITQSPVANDSIRMNTSREEAEYIYKLPYETMQSYIRLKMLKAGLIEPITFLDKFSKQQRNEKI